MAKTRGWFTPETARRAIARIRPTAERICELHRLLEQRRPRRVVCDRRVDPLYFRLLEALWADLRSLRREGIRVQDLRSGLVEFPARRAGRPVWLCWRVGEAAPACWREGGRGLRPLDEHGPWDAAEPPGGRSR